VSGMEASGSLAEPCAAATLLSEYSTP
jgi:hypothetical protein